MNHFGFQKSSRLVFSPDVNDPEKVLSLIDSVGQHICGVKLHHDVLEFKNTEQEAHFYQELYYLKCKYQFFVIEDRKFADIPTIIVAQMKRILGRSRGVIDLVTIHALMGEETLLEVDATAVKLGIGLLLIHQLSTPGNLMNDNYQAQVEDIVISGKLCCLQGIVSQKKVPGNYPTFTPGISSVDQVEKMSKNSGPRDYIIVGRAIYQASDPESAAKGFCKTSLLGSIGASIGIDHQLAHL
jgi:orotidine 5'-phosphate decarboxylase subfamily 1